MHDFEDIIYIIDNRSGIVGEIKNTNLEIKSFLQSQILKLVNNVSYDEILTAHIHPLIIEERAIIVKEKISQILSL